MGALELLLALAGFHFLADFGLVTDWMQTAKNRRVAVPGVPWQWPMLAHAGIHGLLVGLATGVWWLGLLETAAHFWIDDQKCQGELTFQQDQLAHLACKALWVALLVVKLVLS